MLQTLTFEYIMPGDEESFKDMVWSFYEHNVCVDPDLFSSIENFADYSLNGLYEWEDFSQNLSQFASYYLRGDYRAIECIKDLDDREHFLHQVDQLDFDSDIGLAMNDMKLFHSREEYVGHFVEEVLYHVPVVHVW